MQTGSIALFLDRDGVINTYKPGDYIRNWAEFEFCKNALEAIRLARSYFDYILVVTNQQGVGKGLMSQSDLNEIHDCMKTQLKANEAEIDAVYACTMLKSETDNCRKPNTAMGWKAKADFPDIDFGCSYMMGDSPSDMEFGKRLGMHTTYIFNPYQATQCIHADTYAETLWHGIQEIIKEL